ncbi:MAG: hypothetical protein LW835_10825 [Burkholderiaceae bacterium]|nr:hypothetical protein [Burkholderiaceae bacterium]
MVALAAATGLMLPGCAVLNPHVDAPRLDGVYAQPSDCAQNNPPPQACTRFHGRLVEAVGAADQLRRNYLGAVNQYAYARSGLALTIIPLTAWGVYRGVTSSGGATDALAATAIGAAGGYAVGNQLLVGRRELVYLAGAEAIGCSILAMRPYLVDAGDAQTYFIEPLNELGKQLPVAVDKLAQFKRSHAGLKVAEVEVAEARLSALNATLAEGRAFNGELDSAAVVLIEKARTIQSRVSTEIVKTQPDLASILTAATALSGLAGQFTGGKLTAGTAASAKAESTEGKVPDLQIEKDRAAQAAEAWSDVSSKITGAAEKGAAVEGFLVGRRALVRAAGSVEACNFAAPKSDFSVEPDIAELQLNAGGSATFTVSGGSGMPRASVVGTSRVAVRELVVVTPILSGGSLQFTVERGSSQAAEGDDLRLLFVDGSGRQTKSIKLGLGKPAPPPGAAPAAAPTAAGGQAMTAEERGLQNSPSKFADMLAGLGLPERKGDGNREFSPAIRNAIAACRERLKLAPASGVDRNQIDADLLAAIESGKCKTP